MNSSEFTWHTAYEAYELLGCTIRVDKAKTIIRRNPREVGEMDISQAPHGMHWMNDGAKVDLTIPILVAVLYMGLHNEDGTPKYSYWVIDGWHRVREAKKQKINKLPAVFLTKKESNRCIVKWLKPERQKVAA